MIKAFLFDYDGVITPGVDVRLPAGRLAKNIGVSIDDASNAIMNTWDGYSTGRLSVTKAWDSIETQLGKKVPNEQRNIWHTWDELKPIPFMLEFVEELQSKGYRVGLISNVFKETADLIRQNGVYNKFDFTILSYEVGAKKPDPKIYECAMQKLEGVNVNEVVFLDDRQHCIDGAKDFGLNTIHVTSHQNAIEEVRRLLENK